MQEVLNFKMVRKLSYSLAIIIFAIECYAGSWVYVASSNKEDYFVDPTTIKRYGKYLRAWELTNLIIPNRKSKVINSSKSQYEYNCDEDMSRLIYSIEYSGQMGDGESLSSFSYDNYYDNNFKPIAPETVGWAILKYICGK